MRIFSRDIETHLSIYRDTLGFVESVIINNPECKIMIFADFNCNVFHVRHPYTQLLLGLMERHNLFSCFDLMPILVMNQLSHDLTSIPGHTH